MGGTRNVIAVARTTTAADSTRRWRTTIGQTVSRLAIQAVVRTASAMKNKGI
jgi:hypothetical protein